MRFLLILLFLGATQSASSACPTTEEEFIKYYSEIINNNPAPSWLAPTSIDLCLRNTPELKDIADRCTKNLRKLSHSLADGRYSGISRRSETGTRPLVLPTIFNDPTLRSEISKADGSNSEEIAKVLGRLNSHLDSQPNTSSFTFEFSSKILVPQSGAHAGLRSFITVIQKPNEDIIVHTHRALNRLSRSLEGATDIEYLVIRANKTNPDGTKRYAPEIDFFQIEPNSFDAKPRFQRCISCHRSGSVAIIPHNDQFISHEPGVSNSEIKDLWNKYRPTSADTSNVDFTKLGPSIGPDYAPWRTEEFVKKCVKASDNSLTGVEIEQIATRVRPRMNCVSCHDTEEFKPQLIQYPLHPEDNGFGVLDNVILSGTMPKIKHPLPPRERKALLTCLKYEFFGGFTKEEFSMGNTEPGVLLRWLMPSTCKVEQPPAAEESAEVDAEK